MPRWEQAHVNRLRQIWNDCVAHPPRTICGKGSSWAISSGRSASRGDLLNVAKYLGAIRSVEFRMLQVGSYMVDCDRWATWQLSGDINRKPIVALQAIAAPMVNDDTSPYFFKFLKPLVQHTCGVLGFALVPRFSELQNRKQQDLCQCVPLVKGIAERLKGVRYLFIICF